MTYNTLMHILYNTMTYRIVYMNTPAHISKLPVNIYISEFLNIIINTDTIKHHLDICICHVRQELNDITFFEQNTNIFIAD